MQGTEFYYYCTFSNIEQVQIFPTLPHITLARQTSSVPIWKFVLLFPLLYWRHIKLLAWKNCCAIACFLFMTCYDFTFDVASHKIDLNLWPTFKWKNDMHQKLRNVIFIKCYVSNARKCAILYFLHNTGNMAKTFISGLYNIIHHVTQNCKVVGFTS